MREPDRFYSLKEIVELGIFGKVSESHLRRVANLQRVDRRRYQGRIRLSWSTVDSYPAFVNEGGRWGMYRSEILEHQARKRGGLR